MAGRRRRIDQSSIEDNIRQGFGQGRGEDYRPWLQVRDVPSQGVSSKIKGWTTGRVHEFFSQHELRYFFLLDWASVIVDIREQFPLLPLDETLAIAAQLNYSHPLHPRTKSPIIMTTDFVLTHQQSTGSVEQARTVKPAEALSSQRILEKLEIERCYWRQRGVSWGIVTDREIPEVFARNVAWIHPFRQPDALSLSTEELQQITQALNQRVIQDHSSLAAIAAACDDQLAFPPGTSLSVARHLLASRQWRVNMHQLIHPRKPLVLIHPPNLEAHLPIAEVG